MENFCKAPGFEEIEHKYHDKMQRFPQHGEKRGFLFLKYLLYFHV